MKGSTKRELYVIYDRTAEQASNLMEWPNDGIALRQFKVTMQSVPEFALADFRLYHVGTFDPKLMKFGVFQTPREVFIPEEKEKK